MAYQVDGKVLECTETGYIVNMNDWSKTVASELARQDGLELTQDHWDVIEYLRDQYFNHGGELPNNRHILKGMQEVWSDRKVDNKTLFDLFPGNPSKQAGRIAGLPESMRKGGY